MPGLALTITPAVLTLLFGGQPAHTALAPTSAVLAAHIFLAARPLAADPFLLFPSAPADASIASRSSKPALSRRFIVIGSAAAGLASGGLMVLLPAASGPPCRENARITVRLGRYRTAIAAFGVSF
jgi:hypothetical protein